METLALTCSNCGAPISIPRGVDFLTCSHCQSQLIVKETDGAIFTSVLQEIDERTGRVEDELQFLRLRDELREHERFWEKSRERHMIKGQHGHLRVPSKLESVVVAVIAVGVFLFSLIMFFREPVALLVGVLLSVAAWLLSLYLSNKVKAYQRAYEHYRSKRARINREIRELKAS